MSDSSNRSQRLDRALGDLLAQVPEVEAAAVVSFDGLPMASALPATMDEDRVAAMSAALLSLGERAAEGLGRGGLNQVYIEGDQGTVFLVSAEDEAVLVAVAARGAKVGMMLYEVRRSAATIADVLRAEAVEDEAAEAEYSAPAPVDEPLLQAVITPLPEPAAEALETPASESADDVEHVPAYAPVSSDPAWVSHLPNGTPVSAAEPQSWS
jgi:uncharacterized protein